jgi:hypothetical protein
MTRDILSEFGPDSPADQKPTATSGGCTEAKPLPYDPPKGPTGMMQKGPGIHGDNCSNKGTQGRY